jgi:hypothetical protein
MRPGGGVSIRTGSVKGRSAHERRRCAAERRGWLSAGWHKRTNSQAVEIVLVRGWRNILEYPLGRVTGIWREAQSQT